MCLLKVYLNCCSIEKILSYCKYYNKSDTKIKEILEKYSYVPKEIMDNLPTPKGCKYPEAKYVEDILLIVKLTPREHNELNVMLNWCSSEEIDYKILNYTYWLVNAKQEQAHQKYYGTGTHYFPLYRIEGEEK